MALELDTLDHWDESLWQQMKPIYEEAFAHGAKPERILKIMLDRGLATMHAGYDDGELVAMAFTGRGDSPDQPTLIIDYMAIRKDRRGRGEGKLFFTLLRDWAVLTYGVAAIIIEAEAEDNAENRERIVFWEKCGFVPTSYVHHYIWVPETYRALVLPIDPAFTVTDDGQSLFRQITHFHEQSFRKTWDGTTTQPRS
ncbi:GNAT family N-acetyltransferase [Paenibacillus kandeliae]|uniref:GNAT family N-acetyltransferase n=1 Tax=Paenibacillus kandeliae TaxID=3231269 RepID=UPI00345AC4DB